jgi:hypothetical protein
MTEKQVLQKLIDRSNRSRGSAKISSRERAAIPAGWKACTPNSRPLAQTPPYSPEGRNK